ncbi:MAG: carboxypeptidase-like regulatory domain-containing protein [Planctomycetia bacterium]|nr:carboxypeptidase-like regulatory domain-containing protein [Planctomycetia bacterium]
MKRILGTGMGVVLCLALVACGESRPEGFPETLVPVTVTVTNAEGPVDGARVSLVSKSGSIVVGAVCDASGVAKLKTVLANYSEEGVEPGEYRVTIQKEPRVEDTWTPQDYIDRGKAEADKHGAEIREAEKKLPRIVPEALTRVGSTPLTVTVSSEPVEIAVNLADY